MSNNKGSGKAAAPKSVKASTTKVNTTKTAPSSTKRSTSVKPAKAPKSDAPTDSADLGTDSDPAPVDQRPKAVRDEESEAAHVKAANTAPVTHLGTHGDDLTVHRMSDGPNAKPIPGRTASPLGQVAPLARPTDPQFKVRALQTGYIHDKRYRVGDVFTCSAKEFSDKWMEKVDARTPDKITSGPEVLKKHHDDLLATRAGAEVI